MQILEIYIHTIIYIHIHTYTTSSTTTHTTHTTGGRGVLIHSYTYIYNFFHRHPPPPTPPTPQGGGGTPPPTTTHHHPPPPTPPTPQGGGWYWGATIQTHNHGVGGGRYLAMLAHIYTWKLSGKFEISGISVGFSSRHMQALHVVNHSLSLLHVQRWGEKLLCYDGFRWISISFHPGKPTWQWNN